MYNGTSQNRSKRRGLSESKESPRNLSQSEYALGGSPSQCSIKPTVCCHYVRLARDKDARNLLSALKDMLCQYNVIFKSQVQVDVAATVFENSTEVGVVLSTGAKKTLTVLIPIVMEREMYTSVISVISNA